ncbi:MAG TPA: 2'-5' RNA ligase family protein [Ideonella sp.]|uniref:2'-5' RNA ligase family protein n=1 Tax=Ideonella sp. TaxID=1929293 RepID=UPI002E37FFE8|nr:2'-5' RNA ligase family protein [Ideonella sp.]HEX5684708.1 2'-5' RNA ligase family protein [Ideonella sp.]
MADQLFLDGMGAPPTGSDRLFFAVLPDDYAAGQADRFRQRFCGERKLTGTQVRTEHLHVTLHHLGDHAGVPQDMVAKAGAVAAALRVAPFEVEFESVMSFVRGGQNKPALVLTGDIGLAALVAFQRALAVAMIKGGLGQWVEKSFTPHMTLVYDPQVIQKQSIRPISWAVRELVLIHSFLGQGRHVALGRWPLYGNTSMRPREGELMP